VSIHTSNHAATMMNRACSARSARRCLVRWHSFTHSSTTTTATFPQRSASFHTTTAATHAQQQHTKSQQHAHPQPSSERKFRGKRRSRRQKGREAADSADAADYTSNDNRNQDRNNSAGTEKAAAAFQRKEKETYSASNLSISWTTPSIRPSQHPALQAVLEGVLLEKKSSKVSLQQDTNRMNVEALTRQLAEDEGSSQDSDTNQVELSTFDDDVVSSADDKDEAFSERVASNNAASNITDKEKASEHTGTNVEVLTRATEKDKVSSEEVASDNEAESNLIDTKEASEHAGANVEVVSGIADRRKRDSKPRVEARLRDQPYGYYANVKVVPITINEKNADSSKVSTSEDEIVSSPANEEAVDKTADFAVEQDVVVETSDSTSLNGDVKSDSLDDDEKYIPYSNAPSKSTNKRKAAWFLPSSTKKESITGSEEAKE
jgi:hypothetical protein